MSGQEYKAVVTIDGRDHETVAVLENGEFRFSMPAAGRLEHVEVCIPASGKELSLEELDVALAAKAVELKDDTQFQRYYRMWKKDRDISKNVDALRDGPANRKINRIGFGRAT